MQYICKLDCTHCEAAEGTKMTEYSPYRETKCIPLYVAIWQFYRKKKRRKTFWKVSISNLKVAEKDY